MIRASLGWVYMWEIFTVCICLYICSKPLLNTHVDFGAVFVTDLTQTLCNKNPDQIQHILEELHYFSLG